MGRRLLQPYMVRCCSPAFCWRCRPTMARPRPPSGAACCVYFQTGKGFIKLQAMPAAASPSSK